MVKRKLLSPPLVLIAVLLSSLLQLAIAKGETRITSIAEILNDNSKVSTEGKPLIIKSVSVDATLKLQEIKNPKRVLLQGALHGNEVLTTEFLKWLVSRLSNSQSLLNKLRRDLVIDFLTIANPDSYNRSRYNPRMVDLNRNFGVLWGYSKEPAGAAPFSEAESQAIKALMINRQYLVAIDIHGYTNWLVVPSSPSQVGVSSTDPINTYYQRWIDLVKKSRRHLHHYIIYPAASLGDGGAFEDWAFWENRTYSVCLELEATTRYTSFGRGEDLVDSFIYYERYIYHLLKEAIELDRIPKNIIQSNAGTNDSRRPNRLTHHKNHR